MPNALWLAVSGRLNRPIQEGKAQAKYGDIIITRLSLDAKQSRVPVYTIKSPMSFPL
jgi:hypothetical protein